ncbi:hypothetical protein EZH22_23855 [Xanthobacter dioxanivorans]|uniref:Uncharacterized protein n=1 Tax=Xanthobacter dioxanivorans TaxID=2528964 RepID=A0A974PN25_9HYPH|nr:hypothetical protein [Xanthobacter dioxanivorans]QRG06005.1 hypothetical protein EZH22_23855 [Xanthobacter dioxanivorans]
MDGTALLVTLLVVGAPLALFFAMRRHPALPPKASQPKPRERTPPGDFGMAREASEPAPARTEGDATSSAVASGAAAAAAGGAFILAAGARHHASEGGRESPQAEADGPDGGGGAHGGGEGDGDL